MLLQHVQYLGGRANAVDRQNFASLFGARDQNACEDLLLPIEALVISRTSIKTDLPDIAGLFEVLLPKYNFPEALLHQLWMETESRPHMSRRPARFAIPTPSLGRRGDRESVDTLPFDLSNELLEVRIEVNVAVEVDQFGQRYTGILEEKVSTPSRSRPTSFIPCA